MSRRAEISWIDPQNTGDGGLTGFLIKLKKGNSLILNIITTSKINRYQINNLTPYTTYEISVAAGNKHGFSEETTSSFITTEEGQFLKICNVKRKFDIEFETARR